MVLLHAGSPVPPPSSQLKGSLKHIGIDPRLGACREPKFGANLIILYNGEPKFGAKWVPIFGAQNPSYIGSILGSKFGASQEPTFGANLMKSDGNKEPTFGDNLIKFGDNQEPTFGAIFREEAIFGQKPFFKCVLTLF